MNEKITEQKVGRLEINGLTTINHAVRVNLGMNCSEYVLMNYLFQCKKNGTPPEVNHVYRKTGFTLEEQKVVARSLERKGFIAITSDPMPLFTSKWESGFPDVEKEFDQEFWRKDGKVVWLTSSKKASFKFYNELRKVHPKEVIIESRDNYLEYLSWEKRRGFDRAIMAAERWLNPKNEYFMTDWKAMSEQIKSKFDKPKAQAVNAQQITATERQKEYDK